MRFDLATNKDRRTSGPYCVIVASAATESYTNEHSIMLFLIDGGFCVHVSYQRAGVVDGHNWYVDITDAAGVSLMRLHVGLSPRGVSLVRTNNFVISLE